MEKEKELKAKKKIPLPAIILPGVLLLLAILVIIGLLLGEDEEEPGPYDEPVIGKITIENIVNNVTVINVGDITIELSEATEADEKEIEENKQNAVIASGKTNDGNSFVGKKNEVIVSNGKEKVKGTVKTKGASLDAAKLAAAVSTSVEAKSYDEKTKDFTTKQAIFFAEIADCNIYYPAQLKLVEQSEKLLRFADRKSNTELYVRFTELKDEAGSSVEGKSTKVVDKDYVIEAYSSVGNGFLVETVLYYPDKYSYVYDVLKRLIKIEFMEQNIYSYQENVTYGPNTELQSIYYPSHNCSITIPLEFTEIRNEDDVIYFKDSIRDHQITLSFSELASDANTDNIFDIFNVVAEDNAVWLSESSVIWHNGSGVYMGAYNGSVAALLEIEGADTYDSFADSIMYWDIIFTDDTMYLSYADILREEIKVDIIAEISSFFAEYAGLYEANDFFDYVYQPDDIDDADDLSNIGDIGDMGEIGDPGDNASDLEDYQGDPGDEDILAYIYMSDYEIMLQDPNSILHKLHFSDMKEPHDVFDGDIGHAGFYNNSGEELVKFLNNLNYLLNHGFEIIFEDECESDNVIFMANNDDIGVWAQYGDYNQIVFFNYNQDVLTTREKGKIYLSYKLKKTFLEDILPDTDAMGDFIVDMYNLNNTLRNYWIETDVDYREYYRYFYEFDILADGSLQADVYLEDDDLTYVATYVMIDYILYYVTDDNQLIEVF